MEDGQQQDGVIGDPLDWNVMLRLPRSARRAIERKAHETRMPVAVLLRSWVLERAAAETASAARAAAKERAL